MSGTRPGMTMNAAALLLPKAALYWLHNKHLSTV
jgi:hypothetical protein